MRQSKTKKESGVSIIEVVIVLAIIAILVTFAVASFRSSGSNLTRQNIAREFKVSQMSISKLARRISWGHVQ